MQMVANLIAAIDAVRDARGYLRIGELLELAARDTIVLDPISILISRDVTIGRNTLIEPNVQLLTSPGSACIIGDGNRFLPGTRIEAAGGTIHIGNRNTFGPGGFTASAGRGALIRIGDEGRYTLNCAISGTTSLCSGSQILGPIAVDGCTLAAGGSHHEPDPDKRGAVLKGTGRARGLTLARGQVIQGFGLFDVVDIKMQSHFHPPEAAGRG